MFKKISNGIELVKASWQVLMADKELLLFPAVSGVAALVVVATFAVPLVLTGAWSEGGGFGPVGFVLLFFFYLCQYTVIIFFNSALVGAALIRLDGGDPTVADGLRIATSRLGAIVGYAAIAAVVGVLLKALQRRGGMIQKIVVSLIGIAWTLATYLVVPVLVATDLGPVEAVKRSATLLKKTWGEQIVGTGGIGIVTGLVTVVALLLGVPVAVAAFSTGQLALIVPAVALVVLMVLAIQVVGGALGGIYSAALYRYATQGQVAEGFSTAALSGAFEAR